MLASTLEYLKQFVTHMYARMHAHTHIPGGQSCHSEKELSAISGTEKIHGEQATQNSVYSY
jgi:hypothetical protein